MMKTLSRYRLMRTQQKNTQSARQCAGRRSRQRQARTQTHSLTLIRSCLFRVSRVRIQSTRQTRDLGSDFSASHQTQSSFLTNSKQQRRQRSKSCAMLRRFPQRFQTIRPA
ncbi:unnamed protein product [Amoebophrya sp. A25]|nr:unnamed protein product [Amoebophrya sp. A25]|eukprot:GSA25T00005591001.1